MKGAGRVALRRGDRHLAKVPLREPAVTTAKLSPAAGA